MRIGVIGLGVVGSACQQGFELQGHEVFVHDKSLQTTINDVLYTDIAYVCVSTPLTDQDQLDQSNVFDTINQLVDANYTGVIAIKSTVLPGTTEMLAQQTGLDICFVPEFLRERCAVEDFIKNHKLLAIGTQSDRAYATVVQSHGTIPKHVVRLASTEAEILKYYNNIFNALRVVFANAMYNICQHTSSDYEQIKDAFLMRQTATNDYMDCNDNLRGYGGMCLPKDVKAIIHYCNENNINMDLFQAMDSVNSQLKITVFDGMRQ